MIRDRDGRIEYRYLHKGGHEHYHLRIWIEGSEEILHNVASVEYLLHPSFKQRVRTSTNRENKFAISIWTYGMFRMNVTLRYSDGHTESLPYRLAFDLPEDDGTNFVMVGQPG
jgi:transcription initiation factor IIF auxiliary subunit